MLPSIDPVVREIELLKDKVQTIFSRGLLGRERLTANRTYYVSTSGSDSNDGLSASTPFLTIQRAIDVVCFTLDLNGYKVTIQLADGTYTITTTIQIKPQIGWAFSNDLSIDTGVVIQGNATNPQNVVINQTTASAHAFQSLWTTAHGRTELRDLEIRTNGGHACLANTGEILLGGTIRIGTLAGGSAFYSQLQGRIVFRAGMTVNVVATAASNLHSLFRNESMGFQYWNGGTLTFTNNVNWTAACMYFTDMSHAHILTTIGGGGVAGTTGQRYNGARNANCFTNGGGANYFPGSVAGAVATGAQYN